ncbi:hypothetical protein BAE44_0018440, partial [Dichanthelium oligosanthes]
LHAFPLRQSLRRV